MAKKIYRHPKYYYELESVTRFADVEYVDNEQDADYVAIASSHNEPVFKGITKPILYSYIREHPYKHDEYLQTQFDSINPHQRVKIFSLSAFDKFKWIGENIIIDNFELDCYKRLFVDKECDIQLTNSGTLRYLFLGGKANKANRKPLLDELLSNEDFSGRLAWSMFGVDGGNDLDNIKVENNHYIGYPYDPVLYQGSNFSIISETHFDGNQEFHPTEKTYRAIANMHPFAVLSTQHFMKHLQNKGYETFNKFIDEGYDEIADPTARMVKFVNSIHELYRKDLEWSLFKEICIHNVNTLVSNSKKTIRKINISI